VPTLLSIHTRLESPLSRFNNAIYAIADVTLVRTMMRLHRPKLVVMDKLMDRYIDRRYRRIHSGKVVIPVGIDPDVLSGGASGNVRRELGIGDRPMVLSLGHVIPQRSRIALVRALPAVLEAHPDLAVVVVGGVYHDEFLQLAAQLGVEQSIHAVGAKPQSSIPDYLADADLEVHELEGVGFGTASLEALAVGMPVVAAVAVDNFIDVPLVDGQHLFLCDADERGAADPASLADALIRVLSDPQAARRAVGPHARALIQEHFTIRAVADQYLAALTDLVTTARPGRATR
jgi:glycosyltransferase involved in cell wall biosynthesis